MNIDKIINYGDLGELFDDKSFVPILDYYDEFDSKYLMEKEFEVLGLYVSNHPITQYKKKFNCIDLSFISSYFDKKINVVIYVDRIKLLDTKKGEKMCFITGSDESSSVDVVMFPRVYDDNISLHDILYLNCTVEKRFDKYQLVVNSINEIIK